MQSLWISISLIALSGLMFSSKSIADDADSAKGKLPQPDEKIVYKTIGDAKLELHIFNPENHKAGDKTPCIVFFHGGGWSSGDPSQFYAHSRYLASRGMVAIGAQYRLRPSGSTHFDCVRDAKSAMRWVRSHAEQLGIDPDRIAAGGGSAGGHLAAAVANCSAFDEEGEDTSVSCKPNALVLYNPVFDNGPGFVHFEHVKEHWREFSPMHNISKDSPPTVVFLGTRDKFIPVATAEKYRDLMREAGGRCDLHLYEDQEHGFFNYRRGSKYYTKTVIEMDKFLASLGYLKGEPTLKETEVEAATEQ